MLIYSSLNLDLQAGGLISFKNNVESESYFNFKTKKILALKCKIMKVHV